MRCLKILFLGACLSCLALQCEKDHDGKPPPPEENKEQLPPATQSGENTFGCKVNGEIWLPDYNWPHQEIKASYGLGQLSVIGTKKNADTFISITMYLYDLKSVGMYELGKEGKGNNFGIVRNFKNTCYYKTDSQNTGFLKLTRLDSVQNIVSGRFEFTAVNDSCGELDTIRVTDGRFDIKYAN